MRKQKPVALYVASILIIIFGALYLYTRPGTVEELYDFVDLSKIDMAAAVVRVYDAQDKELDPYQTKWFQPGDEQFDELMEMLRETTFQRTLKTLTPLPETRVTRMEDGMRTVEVTFHHEDCNECGFMLRSYYGETTICFDDKALGEQYITIEDQAAWEQQHIDFIMEHGAYSPPVMMDTAG